MRPAVSQPNRSLTTPAANRRNLQLTAAANAGSITHTPAAIPKPPIPLRRSMRLPETVFSASETAPPTIGTADDTANLSVFIAAPSAEAVIMLCTERIPRNSVIISPSPQTTNFFIPSHSLSRCSSGSMLPAAVMPMMQLVSGITADDISLDSTCIAVSVTELNTAAEAVCPPAAVTPAMTGTYTSMKSEAALKAVCAVSVISAR